MHLSRDVSSHWRIRMQASLVPYRSLANNFFASFILCYSGRRSQKQSQREIFGFDGLEERMKEIQATRGKPRKGKQDDATPTEVDEDELDPKLPFPMIHPTAD
jgi:hypothetical protein